MEPLGVEGNNDLLRTISPPRLLDLPLRWVERHIHSEGAEARIGIHQIVCCLDVSRLDRRATIRPRVDFLEEPRAASEGT